MNKKNNDGGGSGEVDGVSDTADIANMAATITWKRADMFGERESEVDDKA